MAEDDTYVLKPKDPDAIVKLQDPTTMEQFLEQPFSLIAEVLTGWLASGPNVWATAGCRIAQAAFKGRVFQQFARELQDLRQKGKIPDDFTEKPNGYKTWVDLLTILDEETPDAERLEALKAMFFAVNKVNSNDAERILNYQPFQISKRLNSGELLLLLTARAMEKEKPPASMSSYSSGQVMAKYWAMEVAEKQGHSLTALMVKNERAVIDEGLFSSRPGGPDSRMVYYPRVTDLGIRFCENIETYRIEVSRPEASR